MSTQQSPREPAQPRRARRRGKPGQSLVEYALTLVLIFMVAQGTGRTIYQTFVTVVTSLRSSFTITDDPTPTPGPSPTVRLPAFPPTMTPLPPTPVVIAMCDVPNLVGQTYQAAAALWENSYGFSAGTLTKPGGSSSSFQIGAQSLVAGASMPCASTSMHVTPKLCSVPNLVGQLHSAARTGAWATNGFLSDRLVPPAATTSDFTIARQGTAAGSSIDCESTMVVEPNACIVPNMDGMLYDDVSGNGELFQNSRFTSTLARAWGNNNPGNRRIGSSSPAAGTLLACNSTVTVSEKLCSVPDMSGLLYSQATATDGVWASAGFTAALQKTWNGNQDRTIVLTSPGAGAQVACSSGVVIASDTLPTATPTNTPTPTPTNTPTPTPTNTPTPTVALCSVPNMVDKTVAQARAAWSAAGFSSALTLNPTSALEGWKVTAQNRSSGSTQACAGTTATLTAASPLYINLTLSRTEGERDKSEAPSIKAQAYDTLVTGGNRGIARVVFTITKESNGSTQTVTVTSTGTYYCAYGPNNPGSGTTCTAGFSPAWNTSLATGWYQITATAYSSDATKGSLSSTTIRFDVNN